MNVSVTSGECNDDRAAFVSVHVFADTVLTVESRNGFDAIIIGPGYRNVITLEEGALSRLESLIRALDMEKHKQAKRCKPDCGQAEGAVNTNPATLDHSE